MQGGDADPEVAAAVARAEKRAKFVIDQRVKDPGQAVQQSREVQAVLAQIPGGQPKTAAHEYQIADARLKAQTRLGLAQSPITVARANEIINPITFAQTDKDKRAIAEKTVRSLEEIYGNHAPAALDAAVRLSRGDRDADRQQMTSAAGRLVRQRKDQAGEEVLKAIDSIVGTVPSKSFDGLDWSADPAEAYRQMRRQTPTAAPSPPPPPPPAANNPFATMKPSSDKAWNKAWQKAP